MPVGLSRLFAGRNWAGQRGAGGVACLEGIVEAVEYGGGCSPRVNEGKSFGNALGR